MWYNLERNSQKKEVINLARNIEICPIVGLAQIKKEICELLFFHRSLFKKITGYQVDLVRLDLTIEEFLQLIGYIVLDVDQCLFEAQERMTLVIESCRFIDTIIDIRVQILAEKAEAEKSGGDNGIPKEGCGAV